MKNQMHSNCRPAEDILSMIIDKEGRPEDIEEMQEHIRTCNICASVIREYSPTDDVLKQHRIEPVHLSPAFTAEVMDAVAGSDHGDIIDDILGISRKVVVAATFFVLILIGIMMFPEEGAIEVFMVEGISIENGVESEVLNKEEITYDDVVSLALTQR